MTELFEKRVNFVLEVMRAMNDCPQRNQYMANGQDGTFDVNTTSSEVVCTRHHLRSFLCRSLLLKIKTNKGHTTGNTDKMERRKNLAKSEGTNSDCNIEISLSLKNHTMEEKHGTFFA